jgi:hypothetical protein
MESDKTGNRQQIDFFGGVGMGSNMVIDNGNYTGISGGTYKDSNGLRKQRLCSTLSCINKPKIGHTPSIDSYRTSVQPARRCSTLKQGGLETLPIQSFNMCSAKKPALLSIHARRSRGFAKADTALAVLAFAVTKTAATVFITDRFHVTHTDSKRKTWVSCIHGGDQGQSIKVQKKDIYQVIDDPPTPPIEFAHGTTTISFLFRDDIVAAVVGQFVGSKTVQKVLPIHKMMLGTMAGGAVDCSYWIRKLRSEAKKFQLEVSDGRTLSVARASMWLSTYLYGNRL